MMRQDADPTSPPGLRILVVDQVTDTEEVLRAVLEPRGVAVDRINMADMPGATPPTVLVIDNDTPARCPDTAGWSAVPQVIIGRVPIADTEDANHCVLSKPFQYAELIQKIEDMIARRVA